MVKLLIIADDFTGALDTGVQFAARGAKTKVVTDSGYNLADAEGDVLVLDAETRHVSPEDAYALVHSVVSSAKKAGILHIYKKTDSGLRGNIGSELAAAMDALGVKAMPFIPAFPSMNRITRDGVHLIDGVPVAESAFGKDPFEPVTSSDLRDIISAQTNKRTSILNPTDKLPKNGGICVYNAETDDDLNKIAGTLGELGLGLSAGCAGFASALAAALNIKGRVPKRPKLLPSLFMICGSINPVTRRQIKEAERCKFRRICLAVRQKLDPEWLTSEGCAQTADRWAAEAKTRSRMILDANDEAADKAMKQFAAENGLDTEQIRVYISSALAGVTKELLDRGLDATLMCAGGDTLMSLMKAVGVDTLTPVCELDKGVVLTGFIYRKKNYYVIAKSGGFGEPDLLCRLAEQIGA